MGATKDDKSGGKAWRTATRLVHELMQLARQSNARELYVSAAPTASAIGFYTRHGFGPTARVNHRLYDLEPEDIHMTLTL